MTSGKVHFLVKQIMLVLLAVAFVIPASSQNLQSPLGSLSSRTGLLLKDTITVGLIQNSSGDLAHDYVTRLSLWDRSQVTPGYGDAAEWMMAKAKEFGLEQVAIEHYPSGGKVEYFGHQTEDLWRAKKGELWLTAPFEVRLTSYAELPMSLSRNSSSTNIEADVVDIGDGMSEDDFKQDVKGKIVLTTSNPASVYRRAVVEKGAAGIVSSWSVPPFDMLNRLPGDFPDQVGWGRMPPPTDKQPASFAFMITARRAEELRTLMHRRAIRMRAVVETEFAPGSLDVVSGVIRGSKFPDEEIVISAHLDHYKPGANDNASGSASILEMARTLNDLIDSKQLPRPLRTIRFLWVPEYSGTWAWFSRHLNDPVKRIADLNFDMLGENLKTTNAIFAINYPPDSNPSFLNAVLESILDFMNKHNDERYPPQKDFHIISIGGSRNRLQGRMVPFTTGTDHEVFNNLKIPGSGPLGWPDFFYHSSEDRPDKVDPTQLHRVIFVGLAATTTMAYADDANAGDIARLSLLYGKKRIAQSEESAGAMILASSKDTFAEKDRLAGLLIHHVYERERQAIRTAGTFARQRETKSAVGRVADLLNDGEKTSSENIKAIAAMQRANLGIQRLAEKSTEAEKTASRLIPVRVKGKELYSINTVAVQLLRDTTAQVPKVARAVNSVAAWMKAEGISDLRIMGMPDAAAYYADGQRSILDIRDAFSVEYGPIDTDALILYFRLFEKAGVMKIKQR